MTNNKEIALHNYLDCHTWVEFSHDLCMYKGCNCGQFYLVLPSGTSNTQWMDEISRSVYKKEFNAFLNSARRAGLNV